MLEDNSAENFSYLRKGIIK